MEASAEGYESADGQASVTKTFTPDSDGDITLTLVKQSSEEPDTNPPVEPEDPDKPAGPTDPTEPSSPDGGETPASSGQNPADGQTPKTGDENSPLVWSGVVILGLAGGIGAAVKRRKRNSDAA